MERVPNTGGEKEALFAILDRNRDAVVRKLTGGGRRAVVDAVIGQLDLGAGGRSQRMRSLARGAGIRPTVCSRSHRARASGGSGGDMK
jgi:hypothetical protein